MADKDLTIRIKSVGADTAAKEIDKVPKAIDEIPKSAPAIDKIPAAIDDITQTAPKAVEAIEQIPEAIDEISNTSPKAVDSIFAIEDAAKNAARELDVMAAKQRLAEKDSGGKTPGILDTDVSTGVGAVGKKAAEAAGFGSQYKAIASMLSADAAAVGSSFAAIGAAAVASFKLVNGTVQGYKQLMQEAAAEGRSLGPEIETQVKALEDTLMPITATVDFVSEKWSSMVKVITSPIDTLSGVGSLKESIQSAKDSMERLNKLRLEVANGQQSNVAETYGRELIALQDQEATIKRIAALRNQLASLEVQGARQDIESAQLRGGDVELAQANALAVELKSNLAALGDNLRQAQQSAEISRTELDAAMVAQQQGIRDNLDNLDPAQFATLNATLDQAQIAFTNANKVVDDQRKVFESSGMNILRGAENELAKLDTQSKGVIGDAADKARSAIFKTIKSEFSTLTGATGEVASALAKDRQTTEANIRNLKPSPQDTAAIEGAVKEVGQAQAAKNEAIVAALAQVTALSSHVISKLAAQENQIKQLFSRVR